MQNKLIDVDQNNIMNDFIKTYDNMDKVPIWQKTNLTIKETAEYSNIGINRLKELLKKPNRNFELYVRKRNLLTVEDLSTF